MARSRRGGARLGRFLALFLVTAVVLGFAGTWYARAKLDELERLDLGGALTGRLPDHPQNYLLVGSDTREGADPSDPDFGGIGSPTEVTGRRSDTIMVLHHDPRVNQATLLSLPRDLWVTVAGTGKNNRINSAYSRGPDVLVRTIQEQFGIPIHHYVEVDFQGFKRLVDAVGGVEVCVEAPVRDANTGLNLPQPGCQELDGVQALQYARSRHFEQLVDGKWREDATADLGRIGRQQDFLRAALAKALQRSASSPLVANELLDAAIENLRVDSDIDLVGLARSLQAMGTNLTTYTFPAEGRMISGAAVLVPDEAAAAPILALFQGTGTTTVPPAG